MNSLKIGIIFFLALNVFSADYVVTGVGTGKLKKDKLNIVIEYNFISPNAYQEYFAGFLTNALIGSEHTIIERRGLSSILNEIKMDLSGVTNDSIIESNVKEKSY